MKTANYNIRLDPVIKTKAEETFSEFGLNLSEAINVFLHMSIKQRGFPFEIREQRLDSEKVQKQRQAFEEFTKVIAGAEPLADEFDEIISQGINLQEELEI